MSVAIEPSVRVDGQIARLLRKFPISFRESMDLPGDEIASPTRRQIREERTGPDGVEEVLRSKRHRERRRGEGGDRVFLDGRLDDSLQYFVRGGDEEADSPPVPAATRSFGDSGRGLPARPFPGFSPADEDDLEAVIEKWVEERAA